MSTSPKVFCCKRQIKFIISSQVFHREQKYKMYNNSKKNGNFTRDSKSIEEIIRKYYK